MKDKRKLSSGFSLVELMVVVAILSILVAIGIPQYSKYRLKVHDSGAKALLGNLFVAESSFFREFNFYHTSLKAIGFGAQGRLYYNVGFGTAASLDFDELGYPASVDQTMLSLKQQCTGSNGMGSDTECQFVVDVPDIPVESTATPSDFYAAAVATPTLFVQERPAANPIVKMFRMLFYEDSAHAQTPLDCAMRTNREACLDPSNWAIAPSLRLWTISSNKQIRGR